MQVRAGLDVHADRVGAGARRSRRRSARARRSSGARRAAAWSRRFTASTTSGPDRDVRHEVAVHHVDVDPVGAGALDRRDLVGEAAEVGRQDRRRDHDACRRAHELRSSRAAKKPSVSWRCGQQRSTPSVADERSQRRQGSVASAARRSSGASRGSRSPRRRSPRDGACRYCRRAFRPASSVARRRRGSRAARAASCAIASGRTRQRASGLRRRAPSPEQGASTRMRSKGAASSPSISRRARVGAQHARCCRDRVARVARDESEPALVAVERDHLARRRRRARRSRWPWRRARRRRRARARPAAGRAARRRAATPRPARSCDLPGRRDRGRDRRGGRA